MESNHKNTFSLSKSKQAILENVRRLPEKLVVLEEALQRIVFSDIVAVLPQPSFDESTRDGYVLPLCDESDDRANRYRVVNEIPAGQPSMDTLMSGTSCKIMTGGCVPKGGVRVIPYEECVEGKGEILVAGHLFRAAGTFIRKAGSDISPGDILVTRGISLQAGHLELLSSCGVHSVPVSTRPSAVYVCTGSELANSSDCLDLGQKASSNSFLLGGLLASFGACPRNMGIVQDRMQELLELFVKVRSEELDVMISTGGMGPGKYDLVEKAFVEAGGDVIFNAIAMRPGKSLLFGTLGKTLFFGLPGPPFAVRTLFNELVGPALLAMQGMQGSWPQELHAHLKHQIKVKRNDVLRLKDGMLSFEAGKTFVRFAEKLEVPNCHILLPAGRTNYAEGELVDVHLAGIPFCQATLF